jgi:3-phenylpropionate/trans-cinnamate dioxygenase ferredoxin component
MAVGFVKVARVDDIPEGQARVYEIEGVRIVVCHVEADFYTIEDVCTHDESPFGNEELVGPMIECPRHGARFDVRTGQVLRMPAVAPVRTFETRVEGNDVLVKIEEV